MIVGALFPASSSTQNPDATIFPKIRKNCRSFKEVAEVTISQLEFLLNRNYLATKGATGMGSQASTYRLHTQVDEENQLKDLEM